MSQASQTTAPPSLQLSDEQKITVVFRVEPGSLGPTGKDYIDQFCPLAQTAFKTVDADFALWQIIPRHDKSLPELEYKLNGKSLNAAQAEKYLSVFDRHIDALEEHLEENISRLIEKFLGR